MKAVRAIFTTLTVLLALVGASTVVGVTRQLHLNRRAAQTPPNVRNADFGSQR